MPVVGTLFGRSSDLQATYLLQLPSSMAEPVPWSERSFLLTAAGQFRILTGFPLESDLRDQTPESIPHHSAVARWRSTYRHGVGGADDATSIPGAGFGQISAAGSRFCSSRSGLTRFRQPGILESASSGSSSVVEHRLAKARVASSSLVSRSIPHCPGRFTLG